MKIGVADISGGGWTGGQVYASVAAQSHGKLTKHQSDLKVVVFGPSDRSAEGTSFVAQDLKAPAPYLETLARRALHRAPRVKQFPGERRARQFLHMKNPSDAMWLAREHGCDAVFPVTTTPPRRPTGLGVVSWIPDLQHRTHPEFFSPSAARGIDAWINRLGARSHRLVLSSEAVRDDFLHYFPRFADKVRVLPFPSRFAFSAPDTTHDVHDIYGLPEHFLLCPNQFWRHKNHALVLKALSVAVKRDPTVTCVFTGLLSDSRDPSNQYVSELLQMIAELRLEGRAKLLGLVPKAHLDALLVQCHALVQPSLSEGWSTTVQDAKALGIPILALDTPILREQAPEARFFLNEPADLSEALLSPPQRKGDIERARTEESAFAWGFARDLHSVCKEAANEGSR